jgi:hypothetical protein
VVEVENPWKEGEITMKAPMIQLNFIRIEQILLKHKKIGKRVF